MTPESRLTRVDPALSAATALYGVAFTIHNADHARRGVDASPDTVVWAGTGVAMLTAAVVTLVFTRHRLAPFVAAAGGASIAMGVSFVHLLPTVSPITDPLTAAGISQLSWFAVVGEIATALVLAIVGWRSMQSAAAGTETKN